MAKKLLPPAPRKEFDAHSIPTPMPLPQFKGAPKPPPMKKAPQPLENLAFPPSPSTTDIELGPAPVGPKGKGPPLFIKLEKYQDVINTIHKLKTFSLSLRDALDALADVEKELQTGMSLAHKAPIFLAS